MATGLSHDDKSLALGLQCRHCSGSYCDPRILACLHSFCLQCITRIYEEDDIANNSFITCPSCNHGTLLPTAGDVASLPINIRLAFEVKRNNVFQKVMMSPPSACEACEDKTSPSVAYCNDCNDLLCKECWKIHKNQRITKPHSTFCLVDLRKKPRAELVEIVGPSLQTVPNCQHHGNQALSFYCHSVSCRVPVCVECAVDRHDQTKGHEVQEIERSDVVDQITTKLKENADQLRENKGKLDEVLERIDETKQKVQVCKDEVEERIRSEFEKLRILINQRESDLLQNTTEIALSKHKCLSAQQEGIEKLLQSIEHCLSFTSSAAEEYTNVQLLAIANTLVYRANGLQQQYTDTHLKLADTPDVNVVVDAVEIQELIKRCGSVTDCSTNGLQCYAILPRLTLGLHTKMKVEVVTGNTSHAEIADASCRGTIVSAKLLRDGKIINNRLPITDKNNGKYNVIVSSDEVGVQQLSIAVNGQDIKRNPFNVTIIPKRDYTQLGRPVRIITGIKCPRYIAFSDNGDMFVTSSGDHRIHVYDKRGNKKTTIGSGKGNGRLQFQSPFGIDVHDKVVYVAEYEGHRIHKLTTGGEFIDTFGGEKGSAIGQFNGPHDVKIIRSPADNMMYMYVADTNNDRVQVFNLNDRSISHVIDGRKPGIGCFSKPMGIALDLFGNVCISAHGSSSVLLFTSEGTFVNKSCTVNDPTGIAIDASGYHLVNSYNNSKLSVFDSNGKLVNMVRGECSGYGIAVSPHDRAVWIADPWKNKLLKY